MGWASGSRLFSGVISVIKEYVDCEKERKDIYMDLIAEFEEFDWDTQDECIGEDPAYDEALKELHPDWYEDEEEDEDEE